MRHFGSIFKEDGPNKSVIEYDLPSTLFGQFQNAEVDGVAITLDQKLEAVINYVQSEKGTR